MIRLNPMMFLLAPGCMALDGMVIPSYPLDAYTFPTDVIPADAMEEVTFPSGGDGATLAGAWFRQPGGAPPLIWFHGNGGPIDDYFDRIEHYWSWGTYDVFAFDFRGFGKSTGPGTRDGILEEDGAAAARYVSEVTGVPLEEIPWVTLSLGAAVATHTNDEVPCKGMVLESMFASTDLLLDRGSGLDLPTGWFFEDTWDNEAAIADIQSPVYIIHGQQDDFIDPEASTRVYAAAPNNPKWIWRPVGVDHTSVIEDEPEKYDASVLSFFANPYVDPRSAFPAE
jgi:hypothetical protein